MLVIMKKILGKVLSDYDRGYMGNDINLFLL